MKDIRLQMDASKFHLKGPLVVADSVQVIIDGVVHRLPSVRVQTEAVKHNLTCLIGDPSYDKFAFLMYGALDQLGFCFEDCQIVQKNSTVIKLRAYGVQEKDHGKSSITTS